MMLSEQGRSGPPQATQLEAVYVGNPTRGTAIAEELSAADVRVERRAAAALAHLETADVDCVVAEAELLDVNGAELLGTVGELYPDIARVLLTDSVDDAPPNVTFVQIQPEVGLATRVARRVERAVERRTVERERDWLADRFETLVERSPDPILTIDEEARVVFANEAIERVFGHEPECIVGESVTTLLGEEVHDCIEESVRMLADDEGHVSRDYVELPGRHADGREIPLAVSFSETERDGDCYFSAIVRDVSERERLEDRLEAEKRKTKELHEVAVMLEECDTVEEVCRLAVETAEQLLEFDLCAVDTVEDGELVPQAVSKGVPTDGYYTTTPVSADDNLAARAYREGRSLSTADIRDEGVDPAGSDYRAALTVPMGDIGVLQAVSNDLDSFDESDRDLAELLVAHVAQSLERIRSEQALEAERDRFAALFENIREPTIDHEIRDGEPIVQSVNEAFEEVFGYDADEAVGESIIDLIIPDSKREEARNHVEKIQNGENIDTEVRREAADGMRDFLFRTAQVTSDGPGGYVIYTDITDRKQLERDLECEKQKFEDLHHVAVKLEGCDSADEIYEQTVDAAKEILDFDICGVAIEEDDNLVPKATTYESDENDYETLRTDEGIAGRTYQTGESYVIEDASQVPDGKNVNENLQSFLSIPLGDEGVLQAGSRTVAGFDHDDAKLAELLVSHASEALQRVRSEEALHEELDRFAALFENVPEPTADYELRDGEPIVRSVNGAFEEMFGYDADEAVGRSLDDLIVPDDECEEAERLNERVRTGERVDAVVRRNAADGPRDFLLRNAEVPGSCGNYVIYTDITERKKREERHRSMTEDVLDNTGVGIFVLDDEYDVAWANSAVEEYFGLDRESIVGRDKRTLIEDEVRHLVEDSESFTETVTATYDDNNYVEEFTCHVLPGEDREERCLQHWSRPIESGLYAGGRVELYYDVTERTEREEMLDALHGATRELMAARDQRDISRTAVETAREVLDIPHATVFRWNDDDEVLEPFVIPEETSDVVGEVPALGRGEGIVGSVFESGESEHFDNAWDDPRAAENGSEGIRAFGAFPLGDWGVMTVVSSEVGAFDNYDIDLARVLAANTEVALNRAARETELAEQRGQLVELDRINEVIRDIDQLLVRTSTREEIAQGVCDRLADSTHYRFAWMDANASPSKGVRPSAWAGVEDGYIDDAMDISDETPDGPPDKALRTGEVQVVDDVRSDDDFEPWREEALERGYRSQIVVPLRYRETVYGVLSVYAARSNAFDAREQAVLAELGETIGHAINAAESKRALIEDDIVEVEFEMNGDSFFERLATDEEVSLSREGVTRTSEGPYVHYVTVEELDADRVLTLAEEAHDIEQARLINEHDDGNLFEFVYTGPCLLRTLAEYGGTARQTEFTPDRSVCVAELPRSVDVRTVVESITYEFPDVEVLAQRERDRPERTVQEFRTALDDDLTDRQRSALEAAYYAGFFEWPRESNGEEVSESLGVSAPTFHQHLRVGERKLLSSFLDG